MDLSDVSLSCHCRICEVLKSRSTRISRFFFSASTLAFGMPCWSGELALARGAAHPSGTGGAALAKPAPVPCWRRPASRQQPVCPTNGATSPRRSRGGELAELFATGTRSRCCTKRPASPFQRPPTSEPRTTSSCGPPLQSSGYVDRLRRSATLSTAPSVSAAPGCGCPVRARGETRVASQHSAPPRGVAP